MSVAVRPLPPELEEKAKAELFEDPNKLRDSIQHLKEWVAKQPHLNARTDDQWLVTFLRGCKFSLERTKEKLDLYFSLRSLIPEFYSLNHRDPKFMEILKLGIIVILPKTEKITDPRVALVRSGYFSPAQYTIGEISAVASVIQKIMYIEDDQLTVNGGISIMDLKGSGVAYLGQVTPMMMKKMIVASQYASPIRLKAGHFVNVPTGFETLFNFGKSFMPEKNRNRSHVHSKGYESLYEFVSKDILPTEYGGQGGSIPEITDYWAKKIEEYRDWLDEDEKYGTDESKRPGKPNTAEDMFGVEGSFRKLEFD